MVSYLRKIWVTADVLNAYSTDNSMRPDGQRDHWNSGYQRHWDIHPL